MDPIKLQHDLKNNQEDVIGYMRDLKNWTSQIKKKDESLKSQSVSKNKAGGSGDGESVKTQSTPAADSSQRSKVAKKSEPSAEVIRLKEAGNEALKNKQFDDAINHYSEGIELDPGYAILPANRGMAYLKLEQFGAAERDCSRAIQLDPSYIKAYLRRGTALTRLSRLAEARADYQKVLKLEPHNTQARDGLLDIQKRESEQAVGKSEPEKTSNTPAAVPKRPHLRSKKPLRRVEVTEVRNDEELANFIESGSVDTQNGVASVHASEHSAISPRVSAPDTSEDGSAPGTLPEKAPDATPATTPSDAKRVSSPFPLPTKLPPAPKSSYEFLRDWRLLRSSVGRRREYLQQIPPSSYASIFQKSLEEEMLMEIVRAVESLPTPQLADHLRGLAGVPRAQLLVMLAGDEDAALLRQLIDRCDAEDMAEVRAALGV